MGDRKPPAWLEWTQCDAAAIAGQEPAALVRCHGARGEPAEVVDWLWAARGLESFGVCLLARTADPRLWDV